MSSRSATPASTPRSSALSTPVETIAAWRDPRGELLAEAVAAIELLNVLRPAVAVAYLPWAIVLASQIGATGAPWSYTPRPRELFGEIAELFTPQSASLEDPFA